MLVFWIRVILLKNFGLHSNYECKILIGKEFVLKNYFKFLKSSSIGCISTIIVTKDTFSFLSFQHNGCLQSTEIKRQEEQQDTKARYWKHYPRSDTNKSNKLHIHRLLQRLLLPPYTLFNMGM